MTLQQIDSTLQRLRDAAEAIGANLLEVELDPNRKLLDSSALEGESATRWAQAGTTLAQLWQWHALLEQLLDRAQQLRGTRPRLAAKRLQELSGLLEGPSIELSSEQVPLEQRDLLGGARATSRCTPEELLERSSAAFDEAKAVLAAAGNAWDALAPRLHAAHATVKDCSELAGALGEGQPPRLDHARGQLAELTDKLSKDPLSLGEQEVSELERALRAVRDDLKGLDRLRRELTALLADARGLLQELRHAAREGADAHGRALARIAAPAVLEPLSLDGALESQLEDVEKIARHGAWREARAVLEQWTARVQTLLEQARRIAGRNRAPIDQRDELRGLLDACQAKALRLGRIEDARLSGMFERAHDSLYTAPTDLAEAAELVHGYRHALGQGTQSKETLR